MSTGQDQIHFGSLRGKSHQPQETEFDFSRVFSPDQKKGENPSTPMLNENCEGIGTGGVT